MPEPATAGATSLGQRFREVARRFPHRTALARPQAPLSYADLDALTDRIAAALHQRAPQPGAHVAIIMPDALDAAAALLGIIKASHVALPLDAAGSEAHIAQALAELRATLVIGSADLRLPRSNLPILAYEDAASCAAPLVALTIHPEDPACIFHTSGSTGAPKGIVLQHRCLLLSARNYITAMRVEPDDSIAWTSPFSVGAALLPMLSALFAGASLHRFEVWRDGVARLPAWLQEQRITIWPTTPALFRTVAEMLPPGPHLPDLRLIKLGGEPALASDVARFESRLHAGCSLVNGLGLTECGGNVCWHQHARGAAINAPALPIGRPLDGYVLTLVDEKGRETDDGELVVQGAGIGLGYWNAERGAIDLFSTPGPDGARVFRTRDRARRDAQGNLVHLGRMDDLLKVHGRRVDRTLVESALLAQPTVKEAAVDIRAGPPGERLIAWVVWRDDASTPATIQDALGKLLPPGHVPALLVSRPFLPRLASGKIDRRKLSELPLPKAEPGPTEPARDAMDHQMLVVWEKALGRTGLTMEDDFFAAGGDSLSALRLFALLDQRLGVHLPLSTLTRLRTPRAFADFIRAESRLGAVSCAHLLQAGDNHTPLFCVPGAGSDSLSLLPLARALDPGLTVYALQYAGLDDDQPFHRRIEDMAARFITELRHIQPAGPYLLAGTSFGGRVAYEMAGQLTRAGEKVGLLALLDAYGPGYPNRHPNPTWRRRALHALRWWLPMDQAETLTAANVRAGLRQRFATARALAWPVLHPGRPLPRELRYVLLIHRCFQARDAWQPVSYHGGPIHLFRAEIQPPAALFDTPRDMNWGQLAAAGLLIHDIPGRHGMHIRPPHVHTLARQLRACLPHEQGRDDDRFLEWNDVNRTRWTELADWWDRECGDEGHADTREVLLPPMIQLLGPRPGEYLIDAGCGNGWLARRMAGQGLRVTAFDFCPKLIDIARRRPAAAPVEYHCLDATRADELAVLGSNTADSALCHMVLMDIADIHPLLRALRRAVRPGGRLVFSMIHPESAGLIPVNGCQALVNPGKPGQPVSHYYFHRPLAVLLKAFEQAGWTPDLLLAPSTSAGERFLVGRLIHETAQR